MQICMLTGGFLTSFLNRVNEQKNTLSILKNTLNPFMEFKRMYFLIYLAVINLFIAQCLRNPNLLHGNSLRINNPKRFISEVSKYLI